MAEPGVWSQRWSDLLFLHWRMPAADVQARLPAGVEVEEFAGSAWVSVVLFHLHVRPCWLPAVPGVSAFTEVNLRTYVRVGGQTGIYFLSITASNSLAVRLARLLTPLPYRRAAMTYRAVGAGFCFERSADGADESPAAWKFRPGANCQEAVAGSLDEWLLERYRAYCFRDGRGLFAGEAVHSRWRVADVELTRVASETSAWWDGTPQHAPDRMHFSPGVDAIFGAFHSAGKFERKMEAAACVAR